jgi:serine/threonine-protein kinase
VARRLVKEARLASSIQNQHIVDITDSGATAEGRTFIVMEHLPGESLASLIRRDGPVPETRMIEIAAQVADALGAAHARGIIHRDVKPENIFLLQRGGRDFVKVVDFGISKHLRGEGEPESARLTQTGVVLGTPMYLSPEQARGEEDLDHRVDIYALGVILFEGLTGEVPFSSGDVLGIIAQIVGKAAPRPRELRPELGLSPAIEAVVLRAMAKARADRYSSMEALAVDLGRVRAGEPVPAASSQTAAPALPTPQRAPRRRGWVLAALALAAALAALALQIALS